MHARTQYNQLALFLSGPVWSCCSRARGLTARHSPGTSEPLPSHLYGIYTHSVTLLTLTPPSPASPVSHVLPATVRLCSAFLRLSILPPAPPLSRSCPVRSPQGPTNRAPVPRLPNHTIFFVPPTNYTPESMPAANRPTRVALHSLLIETSRLSIYRFC